MARRRTRSTPFWQASLRETGILLREFQLPVLIFLSAVVGLGLLYHFLAAQSGEPLNSIPEAIYLMLTLAFLQPSGNFPRAPVLQIFYFLLPLVGVGTLAQGLAEFGVMLFNRRARSKEWETAVASTFHDHTVLVGLGHLGYRVVQKLHDMKEHVVVIEQNPALDLFAAAQKMNVPVIQDDATRPEALQSAGVAQARDIVLCTQNDSLNLQIALKARKLNPEIRVVIRIFDEDFAESLRDQFGFTALSGTGMAAPVFAAAVAGADVTSPISVEGQQLSLARLQIQPEAEFAGKSVGFFEDNYHISLVLIRRDHQNDMHPRDHKVLKPGDILAVLGGPEQLNNLMHDNG
jgi:Trk K+ transport system NAD-binding subunit